MEHVDNDCQCTGKKCSRCKDALCVQRFGYRHVGTKTYLMSKCKSCVNAANKRWRENNTEYNRERNAKWRQENPEKVKAQWQSWSQNNNRSDYHKQYREANLDKKKDQDKKRSQSPQRKAYEKRRYQQTRERQIANATNWRKNNLPRHAANQATRRTLKTQAGGLYTAQEWEALKAKYDYTCLCCKRKEPEIKLTADHIIPVTKGGHSFISNIQPLCNSCNTSKGVQTIDYRY